MKKGLGEATSVYKSDDDKTLSARLKVNLIQFTKQQFPVQSSNVHMTSSLTVQIKTSVGASSSKSVHNNIKRNGLKPKIEGQSSQALEKRPSDKKRSSSNPSPAKRPKLSEPTSPLNMEQGSRTAATPDSNLEAFKRLTLNQVMVKEDNSDSDDQIPIASRMISNRKPSSVNKGVMKDFKSLDGQKKWTTLEHNGVMFPPPYKCHGVKILYQGKPVYLTPEQEEVATMFAKMRETEYYNKPLFRENFWNDWEEILGKNHVIRNLDDCDFSPIYEWYMQDMEIRKQKSREEKIILKVERLKQQEKYNWAVIDGVKEMVGNFRVGPPGLFRGWGDHPNMGKLKRRIRPCDITINIGRDAPIPECPIPGERWKIVKHDNTVTWLAFWDDPINPQQIMCIFLPASSLLKGLRTKDISNKNATKHETEVATYLLDKLSLGAGNEKVAIISDPDQRTVSESHGPQVERLAVKIEELREQIEELDIDLDGTEKETVATEGESDFLIVEPVNATDSNVPVFTEPAIKHADKMASEVPKETALSPEVEPILTQTAYNKE